MLSTRHLWPIGICLFAALYAAGVYCGLSSGPAEFHDFPAYYLPAAQMLRGGNSYSVDLPGTLSPSDTPTWMLCFEPLAAAFTLHTASWIWFWINFAALALILWLLVGEAGFRGRAAIVVGAVGLMYSPLASNLWFGQSEIFLCLLLVLMLMALRRHRDDLAGLALAAAALLRAYPIGLVANLFMVHRSKAPAWTAGGVILGGLLTIWLDGWRVITTYIELIGLSRGAGVIGLNSTMRVAPGLMKHPANLDLAALVKWLYDRTAGHSVPVAVSIAAVLAEILAMAACFYATAGIDSDDPDWRGFGLWTVTLSLISPLSWYFYFCCFLPLIVGIAAGWRRGDLPPITLYAITAAYLIGTLLPSYGHPLSPLMSAAIANLPAQHPHIDHALTEREFLQLMLTWIAAYSFATAARKRRRHTIDRQSSTLRGDPRSAIGWLTSWRPWRISPPWPCGSTRHSLRAS